MPFVVLFVWITIMYLAKYVGCCAIFVILLLANYMTQ
jgi:hypothetical protein